MSDKQSMRYREALNIVEAKIAAADRDVSTGHHYITASFADKIELEALRTVFRLADGLFEEFADNSAKPEATTS